MEIHNPDAVRIEKVISDELQEISARRGQSPAPSSGNWKKDCHDHQLFGVSISGGGIRSATFGLGVLQGLTEKGLLQAADYVSTVSGGGYLGAWLQGILSRGPASYDPLTNPRPRAAVQDPITFLRKYSNYLAPRPGLSLDSLMIPLIWFRNMGLNLAILISAFAAVFLIAPWLGVLLKIAAGGGVPMAASAFAVAVVLALIALWYIGDNLRKTVKREDDEAALAAYKLGKGTQNVVPRIALPMFLSVVLLVYSLAALHSIPTWTPSPWLSNLLPGLASAAHPGLVFRLILGFLVLMVLHALLQWWGGFIKCFYRRHGAPPPTPPTVKLRTCAVLHIIWMSAVCAAFTLFLIYMVFQTTEAWAPGTDDGSQFILAFLPSLYVLALTTGVGLQIGLMGRDYPDSGREWLVRVAGLLLMICAGWAGVLAVAVFSPLWIVILDLKAKAYLATLSAGWLITTITSVLAARSGKTAAPGTNPQKTSVILDLIARIGPWIAVAGFMVAIATGVQFALHAIAAESCGCQDFIDQYWQVMNSSLHWQIILCLAAIVVFVILSLRVNINEFSMHQFYKNRLVRCYLGASAGESREPDAFTGFDPRDDLHMQDLAKAKLESRCPHIPYPIVNAALNVTSGSELATQERKALPWFFTPLYSGFAPSRADRKALIKAHNDEAMEAQAIEPTFVKTEDFLGGGVHLGTATAISGAAVNPNMGFHTSPQTAFLLTLFNVRLGWWVGNPQDPRTFTNPGPKFALRWLLSELFGSVKEDTAYLNLSDGGHFENLGLYELVRRRCHFIIAIDGEEDAGYRFESLGGAVRKCRTDFGVEIDIDPRPIQPKDGFNGSHCVMGRIHYPPGEFVDAAGHDQHGWLLYIKSSITGNEPADVEEYRREHAEFPQQSTGDQFFSESQFESYRRLGLHVAHTTLDHHVPNLTLADAFQRLAQQWELAAPRPAGVSTHLGEAYSTLMERLSKTEGLNKLDVAVIQNF
ncbi:MAG: hypothetical protein LAP21_24720, partial [Acidobacteriia bacterium]|nr:hypothetical protein [Terriglobia bacterium]